MPAQTCPNCQLGSPDYAKYCDCGYDFVRREMSHGSKPTPARVDRGLVIVGGVLLLLGTVGTVVGLGFGAPWLGIVLLAVGVAVLARGLWAPSQARTTSGSWTRDP